MASSELARTDRSRIRRNADRARYDRETVDAVLDEALVCHVGFAIDGRAWAVPTTFARVGDFVYLHGATGNFALRTLSAGADVCLTVTLLDGLVFAKSAFHHSMSYRSVMLFGRATPVTDDDEKLRALLAIVDHMQAGRSAEARPPTASELRATSVVRLEIDEGSAKVRSGGPIDDPEDAELRYWAGVVPVSLVRGAPEPEQP